MPEQKPSEQLRESTNRIVDKYFGSISAPFVELRDEVKSVLPAIERLEEKVDILEEIEHLRHTCVVCGCALIKDEHDPPHCYSCLSNDDYAFDWNSAMSDHYRMLDELNAAPDAAQEGGDE